MTISPAGGTTAYVNGFALDTTATTTFATGLGVIVNLDPGDYTLTFTHTRITPAPLSTRLEHGPTECQHRPSPGRHGHLRAAPVRRVDDNASSNSSDTSPVEKPDSLERWQAVVGTIVGGIAAQGGSLVFVIIGLGALMAYHGQTSIQDIQQVPGAPLLLTISALAASVFLIATSLITPWLAKVRVRSALGLVSAPFWAYPAAILGALGFGPHREPGARSDEERRARLDARHSRLLERLRRGPYGIVGVAPTRGHARGVRGDLLSRHAPACLRRHVVGHRHLGRFLCALPH